VAAVQIQAVSMHVSQFDLQIAHGSNACLNCIVVRAGEKQVNWLAVRHIHWNFRQDVAAASWPDTVMRTKPGAVKEDIVASS
jgi:hypothetical protein